VVQGKRLPAGPLVRVVARFVNGEELVERSGEKVAA
jgi:hypothetical protein